MADEYGLQGLNGVEIVDDILAQLKKRLLGDCFLRPSDSYSRGYSAKISYHVECYGLDQATVDAELTIGTVLDESDAEITDDVLEIEKEEDLGEVRDRIEAAKNEDGEGELGEGDAPEPTNAEAVRLKRKYTRKVQLTAAGVNGGAEAFKE